MDSLNKDFPDANIHAEETGKIDKGSDYTFVIDPLDGTNNFALDIPMFCVSIGLMKKGEIIAAVIYNPILDQVYRAEKGQGAFCDDLRIKVNQETAIERCSVSYSCGYINVLQEYLTAYKNLGKKKVKRVMLNWAPTIDFCLLASGKIEAFISNRNELHDFAAGKLIAREAGALICNLDGSPEQFDSNDKFLVTNTAQIQKEVLECLKKE
jgi:myo-inositol-1(or 4)-monophosphatase